MAADSIRSRLTHLAAFRGLTDLRLLAMVAAAGLLTTASPGHAVPSIPHRNLDLVAYFNDFPPVAGANGYSSCWHYVHGDGREYAVIGHRRGIGIYNVTNPGAAYLVDSISGPTNNWREIKSYRNWLYVVSEANGVSGAGLQIVRMTDPEHPVLAGTYTATFTSAHTVTIDTTRALLFANGTRLASPNAQDAGMRILSLANPEAPVEVGRWPATALPIQLDKYVHDAVVRGTTLYAAAIYGGGIRVIDTSNPAAPFEATNFGYFGARYCHNSWPDASGQYLYVTDETNGMPLSVFDISSFTTPFKLPVYEWTANPQAVVHNAHVRGNDLVLAHYTEGVYVLDATDPHHPAAFGYADTYAGPTGGFHGCWGVDPFLPSGLIVASDIQTGLYVLQVQRNYGRLRIEVTDAGTGEPMDSVMVHLTSQGDSLQTPFWGDGVVAFAPDPGSHTVVVKRFGYETAMQTATVTFGSSQTLAFALVRKPTGGLTGIVRDATTLMPLSDAEVNLLYTPVHQHTMGSGAYALDDVPDDVYMVAVRRPGHIPVIFPHRIGPGSAEVVDVPLQPAPLWDNLSTGAGWSVTPAFNESHVQGSGRWTRVEPYGTSDGSSGEHASHLARDVGFEGGRSRPRAFPEHDDHEGNGATPGQAQPNLDRSPAPDSLCFVTGNDPTIPSSVLDRADVDSTTTLVSAPYDLSGMATPMIGMWMWFYSQFRHPDDYLAIAISNNNGATWAPVDTLRGIRNHWSEYGYPVASYVTPTAQVRLRFTAVDGGEPSVVEAAIDDIIAYDAATVTPVDADGGGASPHRSRFEAIWPNPARAEIRFVLAWSKPEAVEVDVIDVSGRRVRSLHRSPAAVGRLALRWDGLDERGRPAPAGLFYVRARGESGVTASRFVRVR
jgi:choice-of-anchor B domain-containing protein